jgi:DnaJ-class molecular chaperone
MSIYIGPVDCWHCDNHGFIADCANCTYRPGLQNLFTPSKMAMTEFVQCPKCHGSKHQADGHGGAEECSMCHGTGQATS